MSLVDYQSSSEESDDNDSAFETQPSSHTQEAVKEPIKKREPVKITIPSLAEEEDDDEEESSKKKLKVNNSSNLLGMLPAPKHLIGKGDTLTPYVLTKKKESPANSVKVPKVPPSVPIHSYERTSEKASLDSVPEPESPSKCDFFSLQSFDKIEDVPLPGETPVMFKSLPTPVSSTFYTMSDIPLPSSSPSSTSSDSLPLNSEAHPSTYSAVESYSSPVLDNTPSSVSNDENADGQAAIPQEPEDIMNDERFRRLHGKRGKAGDLNIIDVNLEKELPNQTEWHTKSLTEEKNLFHSRQKHHMPTQQQKRKHQITYLAFQAKERELDLKNQWAQNRLTKRETQAKYGF